MLEGILVGIIDASLLRKAMQSCSGVDKAALPTPWDDDAGANESATSVCFSGSATARSCLPAKARTDHPKV